LILYSLRIFIKKSMNRFVFLIIMMPSFFLFSQGIAVDKAPKVGLVLSGGGAKGFAHIGVLKVLESSGVKLDYIGGTSMGAVVGGLYAAGYSAIEIDSIITSLDFPKLLQDKLPRAQSSFFEKQYGEKSVITFPVRKRKISLPKGLATGQSIYNNLKTLFEPVDSITDFEKLPIPFFCVATNLETGKSKVFDQGSLSATVRASASLPTLLNPIIYEGVAYIDGGISDNFPVFEMRKKGIDIIIGVDVQGKLENKEAVHSVVDILNQIVNFQIYAKDSEKLSELDIHVAPKVEDFSITSFDRVSEIIDLGENAINHQKEVFDKIAKLQGSTPEKKEKKRVVKKYTLSNFKTAALKNYSRSFILGKLKLQKGDVVTYAELDEKIGGLSSAGDFDLIQYKLTPSKKDSYLLSLQMDENEVASYFKLGLNYDPIYKSGLLLNFTQKHLLQKNDIFSFDLVVGDNIRADFNYFVDNGFYTSYGINSRFNQFRINAQLDGTEFHQINEGFIDVTSLVYLQSTYNKQLAVGLGLEHKFLELYSDASGGSTTFFEKSHYFNSLGYIKLDSYDHRHFPTEGFLVDGEFKWFMDSSDYNDNFSQFSQIKLKLGAAKTFFQRFTLQFTAEGGTTLDENTTEQFRFTLGGYGNNLINNHISFYGYDFQSFEDDSYLKGLLELRCKIVKNHFLSFAGNFAGTDLDIYNGGKIFQDIKSGYALGYGYNSIIGPLKLLNTWSPERNSHRWFFSLGLIF
jgi:NTE family protein